jgi:hypothetical protein
MIDLVQKGFLPKGSKVPRGAIQSDEPAQAAGGARGQSVEPIPIGGRPSPRAPIRVLPRWGGAATGVPARIITSGPTASDPTRSFPFPPAATPGLLHGTSSYSQVMNSRVREGQRQRTIRQRASYTQSYKSSRNSQGCSPHSKPPSRRVKSTDKQEVESARLPPLACGGAATGIVIRSPRRQGPTELAESLGRAPWQS